VTGVADSAAIRVGRPVVVVDLLGDGGGSLEAGKTGQQEQYQDWA